MENEENCCCKVEIKESKGFWSGIMYGLLPHTGCIAFILFTILGVTTATAFIKPLLLSRYFFYGLIGLSFVFATISAIIYLKKNKMLSLDGIKRKKSYLSILYGTSIAVNLLLFLVIFPLAANMTSATPTGNVVTNSLSEMTLKVEIPCSGHAPLITDELKTISGVESVKFRFPNYFDVSYDGEKTNQQEILSLKVFSEYPATKVSGSIETQQNALSESSGLTNKVSGACSTSGGCGGCGSCGGHVKN